MEVLNRVRLSKKLLIPESNKSGILTEKKVTINNKEASAVRLANKKISIVKAKDVK